jgi:hypothetical protein
MERTVPLRRIFETILADFACEVGEWCTRATFLTDEVRNHQDSHLSCAVGDTLNPRAQRSTTGDTKSISADQPSKFLGSSQSKESFGSKTAHRY